MICLDGFKLKVKTDCMGKKKYFLSNLFRVNSICIKGKKKKNKQNIICFLF